jgi:LysR family glycine cleavage system transcriptional activator
MKPVRRPQLLIGLADFEAAARCGSFASAAIELGVSASAVSQQVKQLEDRLGVRLFDRRPQSLSVTPPGEKLLATLTSAFDLIESSLSVLQPPQERLTLSMPAVFAANWFLPRMTSFRENYPRFEVVPRSSGNLLTPGLEGVSLAICYGRAGWGNLDCRFLFGEALVPVCSPGYLNEGVEAMGEPPFAGHRMLVCEARPTLWMEWASATQLEIVDGNLTTFGDDLLVVQAAINGHGIALLDCNLVSRQLNSGQLVALANMPRWETGEGWHLVFEERIQTEEGFTALIDWLLMEASEDLRFEHNAGLR